MGERLSLVAAPLRFFSVNALFFAWGGHGTVAGEGLRSSSPAWTTSCEMQTRVTALVISTGPDFSLLLCLLCSSSRPFPSIFFSVTSL